MEYFLPCQETRMSQSSVILVLPGELLSPTALRKNTCDSTASRTAVTPSVSPKGAQDVKNTGYWPQMAEMHMKGMSTDSYIFPYIEKG